VADLARVHEAEPSGYNGAFKIVPTMFAARNPLRFQIGFEITLFDPASCVFQFTFDYYSNREWIMKLMQTGRFAIETCVPDYDGRPPSEGGFISLTIDADVCSQIAMQASLIELSVEELKQNDPDIFKNRYIVPSLWRGQVWIARMIPTTKAEKVKPPYVPRGRQNRYRDN
jgi:hypothetical protein